MTNPALTRRARGLLPIAIAFLCALTVGALGGLSTDLTDWYFNLKKPSWQPPDWLFGPVWTTLYAMIAVSGYLCWRYAQDRKQRDWLMVLFAANAFLNVFWSLLFFGLRRPDWSLIEVVFLWLSIVWMLIATARVRKLASLLLVPYLLWVSFASALNYAIVRLNAPFG